MNLEKKDILELIEKVKEGDSKAFEELLILYQKKIFGLAYHILLNKDEADEIVQAVFITLWKSIKKIKDINKFNTWLYRTTLNKSIDLLRKKKREKTKEMEEYRGADISEKKMVLKYDLYKIYKRIVKRLPIQQKIVFILKDIYGIEMKEISEIMKINESTVRSHLSLARQYFIKEITENYPEYKKGE